MSPRQWRTCWPFGGSESSWWRSTEPRFTGYWTNREGESRGEFSGYGWTPEGRLAFGSRAQTKGAPRLSCRLDGGTVQFDEHVSLVSKVRLLLAFSSKTCGREHAALRWALRTANVRIRSAGGSEDDVALHDK